MKYNKKNKIIILMFLMLFTNTMNALNTNSIVMPIEKLIKTFGITSIEKSLLNRAKYSYSAGKLIAKRNNTFFPHIKDAIGRTNIERMKSGIAPIGKDGKSIELHHLKQKDNGIIVELTSQEHNINSKILHQYKTTSEIDRQSFNAFKRQYWRNRAKDFE